MLARKILLSLVSPVDMFSLLQRISSLLIGGSPVTLTSSTAHRVASLLAITCTFGLTGVTATEPERTGVREGGRIITYSHLLK